MNKLVVLFILFTFLLIGVNIGWSTENKPQQPCLDSIIHKWTKSQLKQTLIGKGREEVKCVLGKPRFVTLNGKIWHYDRNIFVYDPEAEIYLPEVEVHFSHKEGGIVVKIEMY
jgi:hypothetical protein